MPSHADIGFSTVASSGRSLSPEEAGAALLTADAGARLRAMARQRSLIVDLDDTLNTNQALFSDAHAALRPVFASLDPSGPAADLMTYTQMCRDINNQWLPVLGYTPKRWLHCAQLTAATVAGRDLAAEESAQVQAAAQIALGVGEIRPGVRSALQALRQHQVPMLLMTKGEREIQQKKIDAHGLSAAFSGNVLIVEAKTSAVFTEAASRFGLKRPVSVGDSRASDVLPALDAGMDSVLIDMGWRWDDPDHNADDGLVRVASFPHAVLHLLGL